MALGPIRLEQDQTTAQLQVQKVRVGGCQEERVGTEVVGTGRERWGWGCLSGQRSSAGASGLCMAEPRAPREVQHMPLASKRKKEGEEGFRQMKCWTSEEP